MTKHTFNVVGWLILLGIAVLWLSIGYTDWYTLLLLIATVSFSISDDKMKKWQWLSLSQLMQLIVWLVIAVAIGFVLIQLGNYLINDLFHLEGTIKIISLLVATIISLVIAAIPFGRALTKIDADVYKKYNDSINQ